MKYFFLTTDGESEDSGLSVGPFNAVVEQNDYEVTFLLVETRCQQLTAPSLTTLDPVGAPRHDCGRAGCPLLCAGVRAAP